ncbi:MAG: leucyl/phenylalanyl-tRNA--protein transferase [Treponema sp.]|jgi:leucyl/phenylalanyl-tRNA--protein transferase|nr:leucyl/phenylalanyl-tRNA--protein transferase [Treponema sp.]
MKTRAGPDPDFPYLAASERISFPPPEQWRGDMVAVGGNLSPGMLLSAYEQGVFPWYNPEDPLIWQSPDPRFVIFPGGLHVSASMRKLLRQGVFSLSFDRDFAGVIAGAAAMERPGQGATWITADIVEGYRELHRLGWAHSAEAWQDGILAGGCYGIRLGRVFVGESMFARVSNASKAAFLSLAAGLFADGLEFIDCQIHTNHLESLGGVEMGRGEYLERLGRLMEERRGLSPAARDLLDRRGNWSLQAGVFGA